MLRDARAFSGFSVDDLEDAKEFYGDILGLEVEDADQGLMLKLAGGGLVFVYAKDDHVPATYTILNFPVDDIDQAVDALIERGVEFENYEGMTDEKGVARGLSSGQGPDIGWFKDPAGNFLAVMQDH